MSRMNEDWKWERRFLDMAQLISTWSKDPSTQVGAVIVRPDMTVASVGYNGFPRGMKDHTSLYADRDVKLSRIVHAEMNAILHAKEPLKGYTLFTYPVLTCDRCAVHVIQSGIIRVCAPIASPELFARWHEQFKKAKEYYLEGKVIVTEL